MSWMLYLLYRSLQNYDLYGILIDHENNLAILFHKKDPNAKITHIWKVCIQFWCVYFFEIDCAKLPVVCQWISAISYSFPDKLDWKGPQVPN